jgi:hypothetical protein
MNLKKKWVQMKIKFLILILLISAFSYSQDKNGDEDKISPTFFQFDLSLPLKSNTNRNNSSDNNSNNNWFIPDGVGAKFGYGIQKDKWIGVSLHTGIDWKLNEKMVAIPIYGNLRLSPGFNNGTRITLQAGFGKGFALGRGNLSGKYQKISLGVETDADLIIFVELSEYDFKINNVSAINSVSLGMALRTF